MKISVLSLLLSLGCAEETQPQSTYEPRTCIPAEECCRVCDASQACGDACISPDNECSAGTGCACDAVDVCADGDSGA